MVKAPIYWHNKLETPERNTQRHDLWLKAYYYALINNKSIEQAKAFANEAIKGITDNGKNTDNS